MAQITKYPKTKSEEYFFNKMDEIVNDIKGSGGESLAHDNDPEDYETTAKLHYELVPKEIREEVDKYIQA